jgi:alpha-1,4-digalacturonate transport system substrate-binding protein
MKKIVAISLAALMAINTVGCSQSSGSSSGSGSGSSKATTGTITLLLSEEPSDSDPLTISCKAWEKATGNSVKMTVIPYDDQETKWPTMSKSGQVPDLMTSTGIHQLYESDFVDMQKEFDLSDFDTNCVKLLATSYTSSKVTGLPEDESITNMYYNKDAFKKAGLTAPIKNSDAWTWDEFYKNMKTLQSKASVKYGFACDFSRARYDNLMYSFGGSLVKKVSSKWQVTAAQSESVAALTLFSKMNQDGTMPKQIWAGGTTDNPANYFTNGDVGVLLSGCWKYNKFSTDITKFKWGVMVSPKQKVQSCISGGSALAVPAKAKNKDLAMSFLKWFYTKDNYQTFINNTQQLSVLKDVKFAPSKAEDISNWDVMNEEAKNITSTYLTDESSNWRQYLNDDYRTFLSKAAAGSMTPQQALEGFAKELNQKSGWEIAK